MRFRLILICLFSCAVLSGCGRIYPQKIAPVRASMCAGDTKTAQAMLEKVGIREKDQLCFLFEKGTLDQVAGDHDASKESFAEAIKAFDENDRRAVVQLGDVAQKGAAIIVNDKMIEYDGEPFERVMLHSLQSLNYVMKDDKQGARVEIKRAYQSAKRLEDIKQKRLAALQADPNGSADISGAFASLANAVGGRSNCSELRTRSSMISNPYENAFAYYLSSLIYEANGDYSDACIDCESASRIMSGVSSVKRDVSRLQAITGRRGMGKTQTGTSVSLPTRGANAGDLAVFFQCGIAVEKKELKVPVPIPVRQQLPNGQAYWAPMIVPIAVPYYGDLTPSLAASVTIEEGGHPVGSTEVVADMDALAYRNLNDAYIGIITRAVMRAGIRAASIYAARQAAAKQTGGNNSGAAAAELLSLGMTVGFYYMEQADLRSWLLMPSNVQVVRLSLPEGEHKLTFNLIGRSGGAIDKQEATVTIAKGKITFANLRGIDRIVNKVQVSKPL